MTITSEDLIYCNNCEGLKKYVRTIFCEEFEQVDLKKSSNKSHLRKILLVPKFQIEKVFVTNSLSLSFTISMERSDLKSV